MNYYDRELADVEQAKRYIRGYGEGVGFPSRMKVLEIVKDGESLLDVGCGPGCEYENIKEYKRQITYKGVDISWKFIQACKELFPEGNFEIQDARKLEEADQSYDTVLLRHILEFIYPYDVPINEAWRVAKKRIILIFWIPPTDRGGANNIRFINEAGPANIYDLGNFMAYLKILTPKIQVLKDVGKSNMMFILEK